MYSTWAALTVYNRHLAVPVMSVMCIPSVVKEPVLFVLVELYRNIETTNNPTHTQQPTPLHYGRIKTLFFQFKNKNDLQYETSTSTNMCGSKQVKVC